MRRVLPEEFIGTSRFEVLRCIGAGGMGTVYEAFDKERKERVALKTLRAMTAESLLRFKHEFREFQDLRHPNLVSVVELFSDDSNWFFTMELLDGVDFLEYVRPGALPTRTPSEEDLLPTITTAQQIFPSPRTLHASSGSLLNEPRLRTALRQLALGLHALHEANKVHRDIKPSNVLVTQSGRVVLLDFGLATELEGREHRSEVDIVGTVEYMAPEQAAARQVGPAADWYAVGVMLYEALTGQLPLVGPAIEVLMNKQRLDAPSPHAVNPAAPEDLSQLTAELLRFNPAQRPTGKQILDRLGAVIEPTSSASMSSFSTSSRFVGRAREILTLRDSFDRARKEVQVVAIQGESGVGKSALVRRFTQIIGAHDPSTIVLAGTCYERETVPFKAVDGLIDSLSQYMRRLPKAEAAALLPRRAALLAKVFPVLARVEAVAEAPRPSEGALDPLEQRSRLFGALRELFTRIADRRRLVLVIDDLQWADADSLALLAEVLRPPEPPPVLLIATVRVSSESDHLVLLPGMQTLPLQRLSPAEGRELADVLLHRAHAPAGLKPHQVAQEAGGHPLFIDELIRYACAIGAANTGSVQLEDALWARIARLEPNAQALLELVCLASGRLHQQTAAQAAAMSFGDFNKHVALLRVAHLLRTTGMRATDSVEPYHGRVRAAVLSHLSKHALPLHHRRLAVALETSGQPDPEALVTHWREAGELAKAAAFARIAADKASKVLAFGRAVQFYQQCIELLQPAVPHELHARLGDALANAGRGGEAGTAYLLAAERAEAAEALDLRRRAAEQLLRSGHIDRGLSAIESVLGAVNMRLPRTPAGALTSLLFRRALVRGRGLSFRSRDTRALSANRLALIDICWSVSAGLGIVDTIRGADFQARQLLLALRAGEPHRVVRALAMEAAYVAIGGTSTRPRTDSMLQTARALAEDLQDPYAHGLTMWTAGVAAFLQGRFREGRLLNLKGETIFRDHCTGASWELDAARFIALWSSFYCGEVAELQLRVPAQRRESETRGDLFATTNLCTAFTPFLLLVADDPIGSRREKQDAIERWSRQGVHLQHCNALFSEVQVDLYEGDAAAALERLNEKWRALERAMILQVQQIRIRAVHFRGAARAALGDDVGALKDARRLEREGAPWAAALAMVLRTAVLAGQGSRGEALASGLGALAALEAVDLSLYAAALRYQLATVADGDAARELRATATDWMLRQGIRNPERMARMIVPFSQH